MKKDKIIILHSSKQDGDMKNKVNFEHFIKQSKLIKNDKTKIKQMIQRHTNIVQVCTKNQDIYECDGLVSDSKDFVLMSYSADCLSLCFFDKDKKVFGIAHAGRKGVFEKISLNMIKKFQEVYNIPSSSLYLHIGVGICKKCYEVDTSLAIFAKNEFGEEFVKNNFIALKELVSSQVQSAGLKKENISISLQCSKCDEKYFYSYRKNHTPERFAYFISLA